MLAGSETKVLADANSFPVQAPCKGGLKLYHGVLCDEMACPGDTRCDFCRRIRISELAHGHVHFSKAGPKPHAAVLETWHALNAFPRTAGASSSCGLGNPCQIVKTARAMMQFWSACCMISDTSRGSIEYTKCTVPIVAVGERHTAKWHVEAVLLRLGVRSRNEVEARLL
jgi:hypothetical protein